MNNLKNHPLIVAYIEQNQFGKWLGMSFEINSPGSVIYALKIEQNHLATPNSVHGGVLTALLDATVGVGALSLVCQEDKVVSTVEINVKFIEPVLINDELIGVSQVLKKGNRLIFMEGSIYNQNKKLIAKASSTLNAYPKEKAGY
jgi:uncharacterized protein (TIGR00369 family)